MRRKFPGNLRERAAAGTQSRRHRNRAVLAGFKESTPCADCGGLFQACQVDFDHVRGAKVDGLSRLIHRSDEALRAEIWKCEVVCSNCHRLRTYSRKQHRRAA